MTPYYSDDWLTVYQGDCRAVMASMEPESVHCVVTSPPYWGLRDYGNDGQLGLEPTPEGYVASMVEVFREVRRVLRDDGTLWLNLGDSYNAYNGGAGPSSSISAGASTEQRPRLESGYGLRFKGLKQKDLVGIPWMTAFALRSDGWYLRSDIIWSKPNPMPESVTDRPTKSHEYLFLLSKSARYHFDSAAVAEPAEFSGPNGAQHSPYGQGFTRRSAAWADRKAAGAHPGGHGGGDIIGTGTQRNVHGDGMSHDLGSGLSRNIRSVWTVATQPYAGAHFATFPPKLIEPCVKAGCPSGGVVLDPFAGSGTTGMVAQSLGRRAVLIDLNGDYLIQAMKRNAQTPLGLTG